MDGFHGACLLGAGTHLAEPTAEDVRHARDGGGVLWLDLHAPGPGELEAVGELFGLHAASLQDSIEFNQRTRLIEYDGYVVVVVYGVAGDNRTLQELHLYVMPRQIITVHRKPIVEIEALQERAAAVMTSATTVPALLSRILSTLVGTFGDALDAIDDELTDLEKAILEDARTEQLQHLQTIRRRVNRFRRAVEPARDLVGAGRFLVFDALEDVSEEARRHLRDVAIDLASVGDVLESERDRLTSVMDVYMSQVNNRQNEIMRQLTAVSTVFLPLMFITGFFGMNFGYLVREVTGGPAFLALGVGLNLAAVVVSAVVMKRRGWW
jgi:magnesium transporter